MWKPVKGYEGFYEVSNTGKVRSLDRVDKLGRFKKGKELSSCDNGNGYQVVNLKVNGTQKMMTVHKLVAQAFIENPNNLPEVNHKDGDKSNNRVGNLEWCTHSENAKHAHATGLNHSQKGVHNVNSKLTESDVDFIRKNYKPYDKEFSFAALARKFGVSETTIKYCARGKSYA